MSGYEGYVYGDLSNNATLFEFISTGPKGQFKKGIQFVPTKVENVFNLAFGDLRADNSIDDNVINDNKDRTKILVTVANAVFNFTKRYPGRYVYFTGSTPARNRLYRIAITINLEELSKIFSIWGLLEHNNFEPFEKHRTYTAFLAKRK
jgi:hypothetical protein